ncbi:hypothetical protein DIPPA_15775, partial [Diplonema papillatum]
EWVEQTPPLSDSAMQKQVGLLGCSMLESAKDIQQALIAQGGHLSRFLSSRNHVRRERSVKAYVVLLKHFGKQCSERGTEVPKVMKGPAELGGGAQPAVPAECNTAEEQPQKNKKPDKKPDKKQDKNKGKEEPAEKPEPKQLSFGTIIGCLLPRLADEKLKTRNDALDGFSFCVKLLLMVNGESAGFTKALQIVKGLHGRLDYKDESDLVVIMKEVTAALCSFLVSQKELAMVIEELIVRERSRSANSSAVADRADATASHARTHWATPSGGASSSVYPKAPRRRLLVRGTPKRPEGAWVGEVAKKAAAKKAKIAKKQSAVAKKAEGEAKKAKAAKKKAAAAKKAKIKGTKRCNETLRRYYDQAQNLSAKLHDRRTTIEPVHIPRELNKDADELSNRAMDTAQRQAAQAYSDSATAKGWAMRTALSRLGKIARVKAVHPALEMRVNHLTSLGGPILHGLNKRPQINNREAFEAVMRAFEVAAVRHVPKKMANKGRGDQSGHWEKAGVLTGSFRPQAHYPRGWQHSEKWKARARHDRATHRRARGGSRHVLANAERKKANAQRAGCRPGPSTSRPTAAAAAATTAATSTAATSRERTEEPAAQHQSIPHAGGDGSGTLPRDDEGRGEPRAVK